MRSHGGTVLAVLLSAITCGATFLFALYRQLALVEVAASMTTGVELYLLSSSIGDWIERKPATNRKRMVIAVSLALGVVLYFAIARSLRGRG
jgi:dipeptide/tripeptide permease